MRFGRSYVQLGLVRPVTLDAGPPPEEKSGTDTGQGAEDQSLVVNISDSDSGSGVESQSLTASLSGTDTGSGTDSHSIAVSTTSADTASGTETQSANVPVSSSDTSSGTETGSVAVALSTTDTVSGSESHSLTVTLSSSDTSTGTESQTFNISSSDTATGSDTASTPAATLSGTDVGVSAETASVTASLSSTDNGSGTDTGSVETPTSEVPVTSVPGIATPSLLSPGTAEDDASGSPAKSSSDTVSASETETLVVSLSGSDTGTGTETTVVSISSADTASGLESQTIGVSVSDTASSSDSSIVDNGQPSSSDTVTATETHSISAVLSATDTVFTVDFGITDQDLGVADTDISLVMGPASIYIADYGVVEPADLSDLSGAWLSIGGTTGGVNLSIKKEYEPVVHLQTSDSPASRLKKREMSVETQLIEPTLITLLYALNHGSIDTGSGYNSYSPPQVDRATPLTYRVVVIDGWAPGVKITNESKRRRIILRKCLSTQGTELSYSKDKQSLMSIQWDVHRVDSSTAPFKIIDEA